MVEGIVGGETVKLSIKSERDDEISFWWSGPDIFGEYLDWKVLPSKTVCFSAQESSRVAGQESQGREDRWKQIRSLKELGLKLNDCIVDN